MNLNATLLGQAISFSLFVWFCVKYVWPPIIRAIEERQKYIASSLSEAKDAAKNVELAKLDASKKIKKASILAKKIITQANKRKIQIIHKARQEALIEHNKILLQAKIEIEAEQRRLNLKLREQLSDLSILAAEKILQRTIDKNDHDDIISRISSKL
ncbi:ATP synthase subunit b [Candidatus Photodesmus katoptron]|uniref:ATP synthase subunit b n=1 Tax=Candidatus Photodesmus katoptron Akat1 TaxID=1236703 RepID=S3DGH1_9GAMM|nr:F0F1 ATP synthase subunit B [Candidatus Photodesmus katoptron]EPE37547.1 ATP synthase B chain [Candidatus Photodesmus katoptron Akat1]KEY90198.1 ATP synthase subunit b [Candidatus Photodesmus katoptron]